MATKYRFLCNILGTRREFWSPRRKSISEAVQVYKTWVKRPDKDVILTLCIQTERGEEWGYVDDADYEEVVAMFTEDRLPEVYEVRHNLAIAHQHCFRRQS